MDNKTVHISSLQLVVLLHNFLAALNDPEIGMEDCENLPSLLLASMRKPLPINSNHLESILWACTMLEEKGKFWHPLGDNYKNYIKSLEERLQAKFNKKYNYFEEDQ